MKTVFHNFMIIAKTFLQKIYITIQLYTGKGVANHAAACAYAFLLSMAPMLLLIAFFILYAFESSPGAITAMIGTIPFLGTLFIEEWLSMDLFAFSKLGLPSVIFTLSIIWAVRILAMTMQRGLKIVFPAARKRNPLKNTLITISIAISVTIFLLVIIISSRTALRFYRILDFYPHIWIFQFITSLRGSRISYITLLGIGSYFVYLLVPVNPPRKFSAFQGALLCSIAYFCTVLILGIILNIARYNFLYGTLGNLIIILINVYVFFTFFFVGALYAFVTDSFDALLFIRIRQNRSKAAEKKRIKGSPGIIHFPVHSALIKMNMESPSDLLYRFLYPSEKNLKKYLRTYNENDIILTPGNTMEDIFYLLEGEAEILISSSNGSENSAGILKPDSFFGDMDYLFSEDKHVTIRANTNVKALYLPPTLFDSILKYDTNLDKDIIDKMFHRLRNISV